MQGFILKINFYLLVANGIYCVKASEDMASDLIASLIFFSYFMGDLLLSFILVLVVNTIKTAS